MRNWLKISFEGVFFVALLLLIILNAVFAYSENALFLNSSKTMYVPVFLTFFFIQNKQMRFVFLSFLMFSFFGDISSLVLANDSVANGSNLMYLCSYLCLIGMVINKFKLADIDKIVGVYLLVVLSINCYFLLTLCNILSALVTDKQEMILFGAKSMVLIFLVFISFAIYLAKQTKASIIFLVMAISFVFSDVLNYINQYYIYNWSILMMDRLLHAIGIFFAFKYVMETNKMPREIQVEIKTNKLKELKEGQFSGDNILA